MNRLLMMGRKRLVPGGIWWDCTRLSPDGQTVYDSTGAYPGRLGSTAGADTNDPTAGPTGLTLGGDDYLDISSVLAAIKGQTALTIQIVASTTSTTNHAGIIGGVTIEAARTVLVLDSSDGSIGTDAICIGVASGSATATVAVPGRLTAAPALITLRYRGGVALEGSKNAGAWATTTTSVPAAINAGAGASLLTLGKYGTIYHTGIHVICGIYPGTALSDGQVAQNAAALKALLAPRGVTVI